MIRSKMKITNNVDGRRNTFVKFKSCNNFTKIFQQSVAYYLMIFIRYVRMQ